MNPVKEILPGIVIIFLITIVSYMLSLVHPSFDILVISMIFGMLIVNFIDDKEIFSAGIAFTLKVFLPTGIALYGAQLSFAGTEPKLLFSVLATTICLFALTYFIAKGLGLSKNLGLVLSTGLSVCGASAIAIVSPLIGAKKEETSISLIAVMVLGLAGMIFYPLFTDILMLNKNEFSFFSGATLPMLGQVKAAASAAGPEALALALKIKLIRISSLIFIPIVVLILSGRRKKFYVPWFIVVFIALAIGANTIKEAKIITGFVESASKLLLASALAGIGLSVDFDSIAEEGIRPLLAVFLSWGIVILLLYLAFSVTNV
ncbi:MAG: putative sulfate exporter family transporter [Nitrospirae bacterium]|nr:MAG: putative sulfate exporter family transporter [Nitrospirota bacterium]